MLSLHFVCDLKNNSTKPINLNGLSLLTLFSFMITGLRLFRLLYLTNVLAFHQLLELHWWNCHVMYKVKYVFTFGEIRLESYSADNGLAIQQYASNSRRMVRGVGSCRMYYSNTMASVNHQSLGHLMCSLPFYLLLLIRHMLWILHFLADSLFLSVWSDFDVHSHARVLGFWV